MLPWIASTLLLSAKCLKSQLSKAWQGCQALRFSAWVLLREKGVFSRHSFRKCVTRWVVTCWLLTLLPWSACGQTGEFYAQLSARAAPTPGVMLTSVGVWSLWKAGLLAVDSSSHEVPTCSRLGCWLISRVALGPPPPFFWVLVFEGRKINFSDTRESAANQFERISWVLMDYRLSVHSVPVALLEYVTNCAFWHPGGVSISSLPRTYTLS